MTDAIELRDEALARVASNAMPWFERAMLLVEQLRGWSGTGEQLRLMVTAQLGEPHHRNAWGALVSQAVRRGHLRPTGERVPMRTAKSHARRTDVYFSR